MDSETGSIKRVEYQDELYVNLNDLVDACKSMRDASWNAGLCTAAMVIDSFAGLIKGELFRDN